MSTENKHLEHSESFDMKSEENMESRNEVNSKLAEYAKTETTEQQSDRIEAGPAETKPEHKSERKKMAKSKTSSPKKKVTKKAPKSYKGKTLYGGLDDKTMDNFLKEGTAIYKKSVGWSVHSWPDRMVARGIAVEVLLRFKIALLIVTSDYS